MKWIEVDTIAVFIYKQGSWDLEKWSELQKSWQLGT